MDCVGGNLMGNARIFVNITAVNITFTCIMAMIHPEWISSSMKLGDIQGEHFTLVGVSPCESIAPPPATALAVTLAATPLLPMAAFAPRTSFELGATPLFVPSVTFTSTLLLP